MSHLYRARVDIAYQRLTNYIELMFRNDEKLCEALNYITDITEWYLEFSN